MIKGLYAAASAMIVGMERQTIIGQNISNVDTPGFKTMLMSMNDWVKTAVVPQKMNGDTSSFFPTSYNSLIQNQLNYVGDLGLGTATSPEMLDYAQGGMQTTGETYDLAIEGQGFFHIQTPSGDRYTRDGRFLRDSEGTLTTVDGNKVLSIDGQSITIPDGDTKVGLDGKITVDDQEIAQIGVYNFDNLSTDIARDPSNLYVAIGSPTQTDIGNIRQGSLEMSNVNIAQMTTQMVSVARNYEAAQKMVTIQDGLLGKAISTLGHV
jgi:flagellar basal-body rod protein FlgF